MQIKATKTVYTVGDFLSWQREGSLQLKPIFQRREVWKSKAKSLLIDTVAKGMPMPIIFLRNAQDLERLASTLEVVDGQQRLRTLFSFIDPTVLSDFKKERDAFVVSRNHNKQIADKTFRALPRDIQSDILAYEISTHVFPPNTEDELVLRIFARLNSTGSNLNHQELRNAKWFGAFKTLVYDLAISQLSRWRSWGIFTEDDFARMQEVEAVSDYLLTMERGIYGKSQAQLNKLYEVYDDELPGGDQLASRFEATMERIDEAAGRELPNTRFRRSALFYSLFAAVYDHVFGLRSDLGSARRGRPLPIEFPQQVLRVDGLVREGGLPEKVQDAMDKATTDLGRRKTRHKFLMEQFGFVSAT